MAQFQPGSAAPPTPGQVALYGHIAARLRAFLAEKGWTIGDLNQQVLGVKRSNTAPYGWINCRGAPGPKITPKLARAMGIPESELRPRDGKEPPPEALPAVLTARPPLPPRVVDVLSFAVQSDGNAKLRLDVVLPIERATPLLRMLLDAGLVMGPPQHEDE